MKQIFSFSLLLAYALLMLASTNVALARSLPDFVPLIEQNKNAVVNITTTRSFSGSSQFSPQQIPPEMLEGPWGEIFKRFFENAPNQSPDGSPGRSQQQPHSTGSGFIFSADGYVITNNHVIDGADTITVRLIDRNEYTAELIGTDPKSDIALLKINAKNLPTVKIGRSADINVGEWVVAIGSPFGFDYSVTSGIVSALGRSLPSDNYVPFIQTDVAINPGNSGGPLFNLKGEVIGVNSQIYSRTGGFMGLSFAIPMDVALEVVEQLKSTGTVSRGWLGVYIQEVTRELADSFGMKTPQGALITNVIADGPAEKGGLESGDVILAFNGTPIMRSADLPPLVGRVAANTTAKVKLLRNGKTKTIKLEIGELPGQREITKASTKPKAPTAEDILGMVLTEPDEAQKDAYNLGDKGVAVQAVNAGSAADAGVLSGDVITRVNNQTVRNIKHFKEIIKGARSDSRVALLIQRQRGPVYLALRIP